MKTHRIVRRALISACIIVLILVGIPGAWDGVRDGLVECAKVFLVLGVSFIVVGYVMYKWDMWNKKKNKKS